MNNRKLFFMLLVLFMGLLVATAYALNQVHEQIEEAQTTIVQMNNQ